MQRKQWVREREGENESGGLSKKREKENQHSLQMQLYSVCNYLPF